MIVDTTEYKCLQSQFSVLYNESIQIKNNLDEVRNQLQSSKNNHLRQIEIMESEELIAQKKVRSEMVQMEDVLAQIRKEYEVLRREFEQNMAANEQTAPINREMRHLITSLQNHNSQLKGDVLRYKRKYKDAAAELLKFKKDFDDLSTKVNGADVKKVEVKQEGCLTGLKEEISSDGMASVKEETSSLTKSMMSHDLCLSSFSFIYFCYFSSTQAKPMTLTTIWIARMALRMRVTLRLAMIKMRLQSAIVPPIKRMANAMHREMIEIKRIRNE